MAVFASGSVVFYSSKSTTKAEAEEQKRWLGALKWVLVWVLVRVLAWVRAWMPAWALASMVAGVWSPLVLA